MSRKPRKAPATFPGSLPDNEHVDDFPRFYPVETRAKDGLFRLRSAQIVELYTRNDGTRFVKLHRDPHSTIAERTDGQIHHTRFNNEQGALDGAYAIERAKPRHVHTVWVVRGHEPVVTDENLVEEVTVRDLLPRDREIGAADILGMMF